MVNGPERRSAIFLLIEARGAGGERRRINALR
jgi:hypothetical protein